MISNAVKFTPAGGKVQIILQRVDSHLELSVSDTGIGIRTELLPYVFDRFRQGDATTTRTHGGLGLGLSIARNLVELHGGSIRAESRGEGQGSTFVVSLPVKVMNFQASSAAGISPNRHLPQDCKSLHLDGVRVLVVDDEADARDLIERFLTECDCVVTKSGSVREALEQLKGTTFDVIVSDLGMPGEDGYVLIRKLRELEAAASHGKLPAIALTAYARGEDRRRVMLAGFQAHISKPVESGELLALIASLAGRV